jgi:hypothetical protein
MATITIHPENFPAYKAAYHALDASLRKSGHDREERKRLQDDHDQTLAAYTDALQVRQAAMDEWMNAVGADASTEIVAELFAKYKVINEVAGLILQLA